VKEVVIADYDAGNEKTRLGRGKERREERGGTSSHQEFRPSEGKRKERNSRREGDQKTLRKRSPGRR